MAGFVLAQFFPFNSDNSDGLFDIGYRPKEVFYILTLGVQRRYRRNGIAKLLVDRSIGFSRENKSCGAVSFCYYRMMAVNLILCHIPR